MYIVYMRLIGFLLLVFRRSNIRGVNCPPRLAVDLLCSELASSGVPDCRGPVCHVSHQASGRPSKVAVLTSVKCHNEIFLVSQWGPWKAEKWRSQLVIICSSRRGIINRPSKDKKNIPPISAQALSFGLIELPFNRLKKWLFQGPQWASCSKVHSFFFKFTRSSWSNS